MRSDCRQSRAVWRAAWRSATSFSISASSGPLESAGITEGLKLFGVVVFEHGKNLVERGQKFLRGVHFALAEFAFIHGDVGFAHEIEDGGERLRGVQIVGEPGVEIVCGLGDALGHSRLLACRKFFVFQARREIAQALDGTGGLLQAIEREIQLAAVGHAGQAQSAAPKACSPWRTDRAA